MNAILITVWQYFLELKKVVREQILSACLTLMMLEEMLI